MLTVLIATHNGAGTLPRVLEAYCALQPPPGGWKLLAVDNGSTDSTRETLRSFLRRLPLECLVEERAAQNRARNRGLEAIEGDLVVFSDDDAIPRADWLVQMRAAADANPDFTMFGGAILPRWEAPPDGWLLAWVPMSPMFALTDPAWPEGPIQSDLVFSPNMAIRSEVFRAGYRFDESIGPREGEYPMGSETELTRRLSRAGRRAWHTPHPIVEHIIRASQMERDWVLRRAVRYGRGQYRLSAGNRAERSARAFGVPLRLLAGLVVQTGWVAWTALSGDAEARFRRLWSRNYFLGGIREALAIRRERRRIRARADVSLHETTKTGRGAKPQPRLEERPANFAASLAGDPHVERESGHEPATPTWAR